MIDPCNGGEEPDPLWTRLLAALLQVLVKVLIRIFLHR
jgi:hypothetical protein